MTATSTENTKEIDKAFHIDCSMYPNKASMKCRRCSIKYKAFCNKCNSDDCFIYPSITELKDGGC